jgi:hypothetical protein
MNTAQGQGDSAFRGEDIRSEELLRFKQNTAGEVPHGPAWKLVADLGQDPHGYLSKILAVTETILSISDDKWPDSATWKEMLPIWFLDATPNFTQEEYTELLSMTPEDDWDTLPWDFESWLDAIRVREWHWWSFMLRNDTLQIHLSITGWPAHLEAFENILEAAGAKIISSRELP